MSRYSNFAFLIVFITLTNSFWYGHIQENAIQETHTANHFDFDNDLPLDTFVDGKYKSKFQCLVLLTFIILSFTKLIRLLTELKRRCIILTPIFYQSNYVDTPLLK